MKTGKNGRGDLSTFEHFMVSTKFKHKF